MSKTNFEWKNKKFRSKDLLEPSEIQRPHTHNTYGELGS